MKGMRSSLLLVFMANTKHISVLLSLPMMLLMACAAQKSGVPQTAPKPPLRATINISSISYQAMEPVGFSASIAGGDGDYSYIWDFNAADGLAVDAFQPVAWFLYGEAGSYIVSLHIADASGATGETTVRIHVKSREYVKHEPIVLVDLCAPPDSPYIIDGCDISNPSGNGITLRNCRNIIVQNCHIHECAKGSGGEGRALLAYNCQGITMKNLYVTDNKAGIVVEGSPDKLSSGFLVENCLIRDTRLHDAVSFTNVEQVEVTHNLVRDNGTVWDDRISGISFNGSFGNISVHHNLVVNSNSDGIECMGYDMKQHGSDVKISHNILRKNGEQGIWFSRVAKGEILGNYIAGSNNNGVCLEGWVSDVTVERNTIIHCGGTPGMKHAGGCGVGIQCSSDNMILSNILVDNSCGDICVACDEVHDQKMNGMPDGFRHAVRNRVAGNVMCSSECNISVGSKVLGTDIVRNVSWQRKRGDCYRGFKPDKSNIKAMPLFRAEEWGDFGLLRVSPGYNIISGAARDGSGQLRQNR